jgi:hypothetical protein
VVEVLLNRGVLANASAILSTISWPASAYKARQTPVPPASVSSHAAHLVIPEHTKKMWKVGGRQVCMRITAGVLRGASKRGYRLGSASAEDTKKRPDCPLDL